MRTLICFLLLGLPLIAVDLTVHEWGTFTAVSGSDGALLTGLEVEEERLPNFVRSHAGFAPSNKGWDRPVAGVTIKMETPVLYFYSAEATIVRVDVGFRGGSISQWFPERVGGEQVAAMPRDEAQRRALPAIDFARGFEGSASWQVEVLPRGTPLAITTPRDQETAQWPRARVPTANRVRGPKGEVEGFIFYRGLGNFAVPLQVRATADGSVILRNTSTDRIPFVLIYERRSGAAEPSVWWSGALEPGAQSVAAACDVCEEVSSRAVIANRLPRELVSAGLTEEETRAMLATWHESYFERPGLRVFWIVPRAFTDAVLPITITPRPMSLERVLVGRTEVLTPTFEAQLRRDFAADGGTRWATDRYFRAYRERVRRLGGVVGIAPPSLTR